MKEQKPRFYDKEFKLNSAKFYLESGRSYKVVSDELGIPSATLATWVANFKQEGIEAFPGKGNLKPSDVEVAQLRKELAIVREERDILKKALGIFSSTRK